MYTLAKIFINKRLQYKNYYQIAMNDSELKKYFQVNKGACYRNFNFSAL